MAIATVWLESLLAFPETVLSAGESRSQRSINGNRQENKSAHNSTTKASFHHQNYIFWSVRDSDHDGVDRNFVGHSYISSLTLINYK